MLHVPDCVRLRRESAEDGFSLIEALVSVTLLAVVAAAALTGILASTHAQSGNQARSAAAAVAASDLDNARAVTFPLFPAAASYSVQAAGSSFAVSRTVTARTVNAIASNPSGGCPAVIDPTTVVELVVTSTVTSASLKAPVSMSTVIAC